MKRASAGTLIFLALLTASITSGCVPSVQTPTMWPSVAAVVAIATPTRTSAPTTTLIVTTVSTITGSFTPSVVPTPYLDCASVLPDGPWVVYYLPDREYDDLFIPVVLGADGSRCLLSGIRVLLDWRQRSIPRGGHLALGTLEGEIDHRLLVVDLALGQVVREIPLFSEATQQFIMERPGGYSRRLTWIEDFPIFLYAWSPSGRYLAFSGALDDPSLDTYIYDTEEDAIHRLTSGPQLEAVMEWSPDSRWIVYMDASSWLPEGFAVEGVRAVTADGSIDRELYHLDSWQENIIGWTSDHTFVVETRNFEAPSFDLREVDIEAGSVRLLYEGPFNGAALDPETGDLVVNISGDIFWTPTITRGLYSLGGQELVPQLLIPGTYTWVESYPQMDSFAARNESYGFVMFGPDGETRLELDQAPAFPSPDGRWLLVRRPFGLELYDSTGKLIKSFDIEGHGYDVHWLPDSHMFLRSVRVGDARQSLCYLYGHRENDNWDTREIAEGVSCITLSVVDK